MKNYAIIIPALNPTNNLFEYVKALIKEDFAHIIVVNDGSKESSTYIFSEIATYERCSVLTHDHNKGKGRALKTAFTYFLKQHNDLDGVITADADGQHSVEDVCHVANTLENIDNGIILGARDMKTANVPTRSYIGNKLTNKIFQLLYGNKLIDTQTGLRGFPKSELPNLLGLKGERYEYEMNMLIYATKKNMTITEVPIQTLYFQNNESSHYNPVVDSLKIFKKLISGFTRYSLSTILSGIIDIGSFSIFVSFLLTGFSLETRVFYAALIARILSSSVNFYMNRKHVFSGKNKLVQSILKYYILAFGLMCASYILIILANFFTGVQVILAKIIIDTLLGILSYEVQLHWVFKNNSFQIKKQNIGENNES